MMDFILRELGISVCVAAQCLSIFPSGGSALNFDCLLSQHAARAYDSIFLQLRQRAAFGHYRNQRKYEPHGWVQGDAFGVVQLLVQQGHTRLTILVANKNPVIDVIHEVEVSGQPVDGHLLDI